MFVPTLELLTEWHLDWSVMGERTWQAARAWQEEPSRYDLPTGSVIPAHANASHPHLDPNNEHDPVAIAHWLNFSDCKIHSILSLPLLPPPNYNCCTPPTRIRHCHRDSLRTRYLHHVWQCPHATLLTRYTPHSLRAQFTSFRTLCISIRQKSYCNLSTKQTWTLCRKGCDATMSFLSEKVSRSGIESFAKCSTGYDPRRRNRGHSHR